MTLPLARRIAGALAVVLLVGVGAVVARAVFNGPAQKTVTAFFPEAVHVYAGSDVDILGVPVGSVRSVEPQGRQVKVVLSYDAATKVPANASAVVLDPTLVADRVVQLAPVYRSGPVMADGAVIPLQRNAVPVELDELNHNLYRLTQALGPSGANRHGALSRAVAVGDANLHGQGKRANATLRHVAALVRTLNDNRDTLTATVDNLAGFTTTLAGHDAQMRGFAHELTAVSGELDADRTAFAGALHNLGIALGQVAGFVRANRGELASDVHGLATVTEILARERTLLAHMVDIGAVGISNYPHMYTPSQRTYNARFNFNTIGDNPAVFICQALGSVGGDAKGCLKLLGILKGISVPTATRSAQ